MNYRHLFSFFGLFLPLISSAYSVILEPKGIIALAERNLMLTTTILMLIVVIPVYILIFSFVWKYRAGNTKARYTPDWSNNKMLEAVWWAIPGIIILLLGMLTWKSTHDLDPYKPIESTEKPIIIEVVALDWKWLFIYPGEHIATVNFVEFPEKTPVNFVITADAPMNSFWIPQLGGQIYAMAGMRTQLHLMADGVGDYAGASANFSGPGFSGMKFIARSASRQDFDGWVGSVKMSPNILNSGSYGQLAKPSSNDPIVYYSSVAEGLYNDIIMKFMMPADKMEKAGKSDAVQSMDMNKVTVPMEKD